MWEDKITYWAYRGLPNEYTSPPTIKRLEYIDIDGIVPIKVCSGVWDDDKFIPFNLDEIAWHKEYSNG